MLRQIKISIESTIKISLTQKRQDIIQINICSLKQQQVMKKNYTIELNKHDSYPFDGQKNSFYSVRVKIVLSLAEQSDDLLKPKIDILMALQSPFLVQIVKIYELKSKQYHIYYEYIADSFKHNAKIHDSSFCQMFKQKLSKMAEQLIESNIKANISLQNIGITTQFEPKCFIGANITLVQPNSRFQLRQMYKNQIEKIFQSSNVWRESASQINTNNLLSEYSLRLDKKLTKIEKRINKLKGRNKSISSSNKSIKSNDDSRSQQTSQKDNLNSSGEQRSEQKMANHGNLNSVQRQSTHSNNSNDYTAKSQINHQQPAVKTRIHKSSFNEFSTTSYLLNQYQKDSQQTNKILKNRIQSALQKTQQTFKIYQKFYKKPIRRL